MHPILGRALFNCAELIQKYTPGSICVTTPLCVYFSINVFQEKLHTLFVFYLTFIPIVIK